MEPPEWVTLANSCRAALLQTDGVNALSFIIVIVVAPQLPSSDNVKCLPILADYYVYSPPFIMGGCLVR